METRIKQLRTFLGLTLEEFGNRIGVKRAAVSKWENGDRGIADSMVVSICREFNVNEQWLRTGEGEMFFNRREAELDRLAKQYDLDADDRDVLEAYLKLTPEQREGIKAYISNLLEIKSGHAAAPPRRAEVCDGVAEAVVNVQDEVARYNSEVAEENASGGKEFSTTG